MCIKDAINIPIEDIRYEEEIRRLKDDEVWRENCDKALVSNVIYPDIFELYLRKSSKGKVRVKEEEEEEKYVGDTNVELLWRIDDSFIEIERTVKSELGRVINSIFHPMSALYSIEREKDKIFWSGISIANC